MAISQLDDFARVAQDFCDWAEAPARSVDEEVGIALRLVSQLYSHALNLPELFDEEEVPDTAHQDWFAIFKRFGALPFNYYGACFEPTDVADSLPGVGDVADDLADIWRDLRGGLALHQKGNRPAAAWAWRNSFHTHWGRHATSALYALHCWQSLHHQRGS
ncbi:DUF5063 domain-containing protein [Chitinolyticbacter albus]|uniref:DUF5063 domain-containing protein n=1 Tax=Chitinolyticbacter albus TaxID=2961951 RepID=UPI00210D0ABF|nr:DUF5063 domain-containing protein [Chitinolyticbacter albus]